MTLWIKPDLKNTGKSIQARLMPSYGNKDIKDLGKIVDYLLTK